MERLADTGIPWQKINDFVYALGTSQSKTELICRAVVELPKLISYDNGGAVFDTNQRLIFGVGLPNTDCAKYNEYYRILCLRDGSSASDMFEFRKFFNEEFYIDFARPNGLEYGLSPCAPIGPLILAANRSRSGPEFSERDGRVIEILSGHLGNFFKMLEHASASGNPSHQEIRFNIPRLSRRESEVAQLLCNGCSAPEIATKLFLSARTVETHIFHIYAKLGVKTKREAVSMIRVACGCVLR
jgi:DNA-binding CsgD family transcriptional regulator